MENYIFSIIQTLGDNIWLTYLFMFFSAVLQTLFPPYPGDVIIALSGYFSSHFHIFNSEGLNLIFTFVFIFAGTFLSSVLAFNIGYLNGKKILKNKLVIKLFPIKNYDKVKVWVDKYGTFSIVISKFVPGIYSLVLLTAGIFRYNKLKSYISIAVVTAIHNGILIFIGRKIGNNIEKIKTIIVTYNKYLIALLFVLIFSIIIYNLITWKKNRVGGR